MIGAAEVTPVIFSWATIGRAVARL